MKVTQLLAVALLGLAASFSAHAQTPVVGTPSAPLAPTSPILMGSSARGATAPGTTSLPTDATTPLGASGERYQARRAPTPRAVDVGGVAPARATDGGTLRPDQPAMSTSAPATVEGQPARRASKSRPSTVPARY